MNYKELFKQGKLGVEVSNPRECKDFIALYGENPVDPEWGYALARAEIDPVIFCKYDGRLLTTARYDEDLIETMSYKEFKARCEGANHNKLPEIKKLPALDDRDMQILKDSLEFTLRHKQGSIDELKQDISAIKAILIKLDLE